MCDFTVFDSAAAGVSVAVGRAQHREVAALLGDTKEVMLQTYAHFMPEDDDQARSITKVFFTALEDAGNDQCAPDVPGALR